MPRKSKPVDLSPFELVRLKQWDRAGSRPPQVALRCRILLSAARGRQDQQIACDLGIRTTAVLWRACVLEQGIGCVWETAQRRGRKNRHSPEKIASVITATLHDRPAGSTHWSTRTLAQAHGLGKSTVHSIWQDQDLRPPKATHLQALS